MVVCVLGCRTTSEAFARRARVASEVFASGAGGVRAELVVACGGRAWSGVVEADAMARLLREHGVPEHAIVRERRSLDTLENARFAAELLRARGTRKVLVVTCAWHLPRALRLFRRAGLVAEGVGVDAPDATRLERAYRIAREALSSLKDARRRVSSA